MRKEFDADIDVNQILTVNEEKLDGKMKQILGKKVLRKIDELKNKGPEADKVFDEKERQEWENIADAEEAFAAGEHCFTRSSPMIPDYQRAYLWFTKAAELGSGDAYARLGEMYAEKNIACVKQDFNKVLAYFRKAAELGSANGKHLLGRMYRHGWLVEQDYAKAIYCYRKAAELGNKHAMYALGTMYEHGDGVEQDYDAADRWYMKSLEGFEKCLEQVSNIEESISVDPDTLHVNLDEEEMEKLNDFMKTRLHKMRCGDFGIFRYNPYFLDAKYYADAFYRLGRRRLAVHGEANALDLFALAGELYSNKAIKALGDMYFFGDGAEQDYGEAWAFYNDAYVAHNLEAKLRLAQIEILGLDGEQECAYALKEYYEDDFSDYKDEITAYLAGRMYRYGIGIEEDYWKALPWYRQAAHLGSAAVLLEYEELYANLTGNTDYAEEFSACEKKALAGDSEAMYKLSWMCYFGLGIRADHALAFKWYEKAAEAGNEKAEASLDTMEEAEIYKSFEEIFAIIRGNAARGEAYGYYDLGWCYYFGLGTKPDSLKAVEYMEKAAGAGYTEAMMVLAAFYALGMRVKQDYPKALEWYIKAHNEYTPGYLGEYSYEDVIDAFCRTMALDDPRKVREIGDIYASGNGVAKNKLRAAQWYRKAERLEKLAELNSTGEKYLSGSGVGQDYAKAIYYFRKAGFSGNADGINNLGNIYAQGLGVEQDYKRAMAFYFTAANMNGHAEAAYNLGRMYGYGVGVAQNYMRAREWYLKAAAKGQRGAMFELAKIYRKGLGVKADHGKALDWYKKAVC